MKYLQFNESGDVTAFCETNGEIDATSVSNMIEAPDGLDSVNAFDYVVNAASGEVIYAGKRPDSFFNFSFEEQKWVCDRENLSNELGKNYNKLRGAKILAPILFQGNVFDADGVAVFNVQSTLTMCANGVVLPEGFTWRDANNNNIPMSLDNLKGLAKAIFERNSLAYSESWALKDSLASKTDEELLALYESITQAQPV